MGAMDMQAEQRQQQTFSPRLQHAVRLLQLSSMDFAQVVHDALGRNPFLDIDDGDSDGTGDAPSPSTADTVSGEAADGESDRDFWLNDGHAASRQSAGEDLSALDHVAVESSLAAHLHEQLAGQPLNDRDRLLAQVIVESLDDDGYLRSELSELLAIIDLRPAATMEEMALALQRVQALEPAGVAARDVSECMRLQLPLIQCPEERALAELIIDEHLQSLAERDVQAMARALHRTPAQIEQVCDRIRHLAPRPGWRVGSSQLNYVVPDVIVRKVRGVWAAQLNPAIVPKVRLNRVVAEMFQRCRRDKSGDREAEQNTELAQHLQEAQWTLRNVEQRFSTILDVTEAIVRRQKHFLEFGAMAMKPLGLREIAEELGLHESTVSRVTNNKYMATPLGVFELKYFFSRAMSTASGGACSGTAIRGLVQDMIAAEPPAAPLSDAEIARQLARQGLVVARRTVTKYRQLLRIEAVDRRRRVASAA
ncbi:RNA polymerase factor sigma-54 [Aquabacterium sp.]|uniref:RNA polymerase factor sigma-54 n=1 Tax=Aquabacterium sp. TaxID=1872578 RepID=UPI002B8D6006|nr:RNA polymerase factor sigma-54 [Aquabacterium sp.]HSW04618.1 RNA polymerase factor sigma-54 [Aquabacterium sp.]